MRTLSSAPPQQQTVKGEALVTTPALVMAGVGKVVPTRVVQALTRVGGGGNSTSRAGVVDSETTQATHIVIIQGGVEVSTDRECTHHHHLLGTWATTVMSRGGTVTTTQGMGMVAETDFN